MCVWKYKIFILRNWVTWPWKLHPENCKQQNGDPGKPVVSIESELRVDGVNSSPQAGED